MSGDQRNRSVPPCIRCRVTGDLRWLRGSPSPLSSHQSGRVRTTPISPLDPKFVEEVRIN